jgi:hypothetical protein
VSNYQKGNRPIIESICAENNLNYEKYFELKEYPMPEAKTLDFWRTPTSGGRVAWPVACP